MLTYFKYPKTTSWKILYSSFDGLQRRAVELLSKEAGKYIIRQEGKYSIYVLPCEKEGTTPYQNAIVVGLYKDSPLIQRLVKATELDGKDYVVKFVPNPDDDGAYLAIITANDEQSLYYGAVEFCYDYPYQNGARHGGLCIPQWCYDQKMWMYDYDISARHAFGTRGIWTWGQVINDYRSFVQTAAKLKLNQVIIWNEFVPVNAKDFVDYAHSFGIKVIFGFAWGWQTSCREITSIDDKFLASTKQQVLHEYETNYASLDCDGIYFQSFTELNTDTIGGRVVADVVTDFVNDVAGQLLQRHPNLKLLFGLHATSVKNHLDSIKHVDERIEIVWEDCGSFPFAYFPTVTNEDEFVQTLDLTAQILALRPNAPTSFVFKGLMTVDWESFAHQSGPYVIGQNATEVSEFDRTLKQGIWKEFDANWLQYGDYAQKLFRFVLQHAGSNVAVYMCSEDGFNAGGSLSEKICAELFFDPNCPYGEILKKAYRK